MWLLPLLAACDPPEDCASEDMPTMEGPFAACAAGCPSFDDAFDCCVAANGYGLVQEGDLRRLDEECDGEDCDPSVWLSLESAACLAHTERGLGSGLLGYSGWFSYADGEAWWIVEIVTDLDGHEVPELRGAVGWLRLWATPHPDAARARMALDAALRANQLKTPSFSSTSEPSVAPSPRELQGV
jgi:hypothetical protein